MDTVFIADEQQSINNVFMTKENLKQFPQIVDIPFYSREDIAENHPDFPDVRFVLATWNMISLNQDDVRRVFPNLDSIFYAAGTVKYFAEPFLSNNIKIYSSADSNAEAVADYVVGQILVSNKGYHQARSRYRKPLYSHSFNDGRGFSRMHPGNYKAKIGLVGAGRVAKRVAELLESFDFDIFAYDPYVSAEDLKKFGITKCDLDSIFAECDVISNHLPNIPETKGMLTGQLFSTMKDNGTFINTGRGAQVDERGLVRALREKTNRTAILDVTAHEPIWPWSSLLRQKNVFLTPHIAGSLSNEQSRLGQNALRKYFESRKGSQVSGNVTLNQLNNMA